MKIQLTAVGLVVWTACAFAQKYTATQLALLPGTTYTIASAINNAGQVAGMADSVDIDFNTIENVVLWNGTMPPSVFASGGGNIFFSVNGINNSGIFVGASGGSHFFPAIWNDGPVGGADSFGDFFGINDSGQIVGTSGSPPCQCIATLWASPTASSGTILPTLGGTLNTGSFAYAINATGTIVGVSYYSDNSEHATLWNGASVTKLGTLGGTSSEAFAINASGRIVGWAYTMSGAQHGVLWYHKQKFDLGTLGGSYSSASGINTVGNIVGSSETVTGEYHAVVWNSASARPIDLNAEISPKIAQQFTLNEAVGINDSCVIVANGSSNTTGLGVSFVLSPRNHLCKGFEHPEADDSLDRENDTIDQELTKTE